MTAIRLMQYSPAGGCGCKMPQRLLAEVRSAAVRGAHPLSGLLIGLSEPDDAAVFTFDGPARPSLVFTCDFQTPVVDDPLDWGRIAATNALSDVYAMGGRPLLALNLLSWPADLNGTLMRAVLAGGAEAVTAAGAAIVGGHSITDPAPKYGLAVVGQIDPEHLLRKGGARAGDRIILTKPLGVGIVGTAIKRGVATAEQIRTAVAVMTRSNSSAAAVAVGAGLRGATDVTGFGLIGHLHEMATAASLAAVVWPERVPRLDSAAPLIAHGCAPDGSQRTLDHALVQGWFRPGALPPNVQLLLADAQTSGGLLLPVPPHQASAVVAQLRERGDAAASEIGEFVVGDAGVITIADAHREGDSRCRNSRV